MLPLRIKAVKEGSVVSAQNAIVTIENTDPEFYWLTNWAETILLQMWYPVTVATLSRAIKQIVGEALERTGDPSGLPVQTARLWIPRSEQPRIGSNRRRGASFQFSRYRQSGGDRTAAAILRRRKWPA